ncbi:MAG: prenyltransferase/squalene oxidase repeat-containing protein [Lawsonibacter sp.]|jgi:hypothetical protein
MKHPFRSLLSLTLAATFWACSILPAYALNRSDALQQAVDYVYSNLPSPQVGSTGGEWAVLGLARSGASIPQAWYNTYRKALIDLTLQEQGVLSTRKYTEYARVVLALTALGDDPRCVAGYNMLTPLENMEQTVRQGVNGAIYALIALDCGNYSAPEGLREWYLMYLLNAQLPDGGWALAGEQADPDLTAQALQALAPYAESVQPAIQRGLDCLVELREQGAFSTLESYAQTILALCALGQQPDDQLVADFLSYQLPSGGFCHLFGGTADSMASEQGLCALVALDRLERGAPSIYQMSDVRPAGDPIEKGNDNLFQGALLCTGLSLLPLSILGQGIPICLPNFEVTP